MRPQHISYLKYCLEQLRQGEEVGRALLTQLQIFIELAEQQQSLTLPKDTVFAQIETQMGKASASEGAFRKRLQKLNQEFVDSEMGIRLASRKTQILISMDDEHLEASTNSLTRATVVKNAEHSDIDTTHTEPLKAKPAVKRQVLFSYAWDAVPNILALQRQFADDLEDALKNPPPPFHNTEKVSLFIDRKGFVQGESVEEQQTATCEETPIILVCYTNRYLQSAACQAEIDFYLTDEGKNHPYRRALIVPFAVEFNDLEERYKKNLATLPEGQYANALDFFGKASENDKSRFIYALVKNIYQWFEKNPTPPRFDRHYTLKKNAEGSNKDLDAENIKYEPIYAAIEPLNYDDAIDVVDEMYDWATNSQKGERIFYLLGDFGAGKSTSCQVLAKKLLENYQNNSNAQSSPNEQPVLPIYLDLKRLLNAFENREVTGKSIEKLLEVMLEKAGQDAPKGKLLIKLIHEYPCLLIFDGFDEVGQKLDNQQQVGLLNRLMEIFPNKLYQNDLNRLNDRDCENLSIPINSRIVLSCRTHFFKDLNSEKAFRNLYDRHPVSESSNNSIKNYRTFYLLPFTPEQISHYLARYLGDAEADKAVDFIQSVHDLSGLSEKPLMLNYIRQLLPDLQAQAKKAVNVASLYQTLFEKVILRDTEKHIIPADEKRPLLGLFAQYLWQKGSNSVNANELSQWFFAHYENYPQIRIKINSGSFQPEVVLQDLHNASLMVREGEDDYRFAHTSFYEYFLGCYLLDALIDKTLDLDSIGEREVNHETLLFCADQAEQTQQLNALKQTVTKILQSSAPKSHRALALRLWRLWDKGLYNPPMGSCFDGLDLQNLTLTSETHWQSISLKNTQLNGLDAKQTHFDGIDFDASIIANSYFDRCSFSNCRGKPISAASARLWQNEMDSDSQAAFADVVLRWQHPPTRLKTNQSNTDRLIGQARGPIIYAVFSSDGKWLLMAEGNIAMLWDTRSAQCLQIFNGHSDWVTSAVFSSDNNKILTASRDGTAKCFDAKTGDCLQIFNGHSRSVTSAVFSSDNNKILTASRDGTAKCFDAKTGDCLQIFNGHSRSVNSAVFSSDNNKILTASDDRTAKCFDAQTGECLQIFNGHSRSVNSAVFSSDNNKILTASRDSTAKCFDAQTGECLQTFNGHSDWVRSAVFSNDNNKTLTASYDNTAKCFDAKTGDCLQIFNEHSDWVNSAVFSSDNNKILTASGDGTAKCFDAKTGDCLQTFNGHSDWVSSAAFSNDDNKILTTSYDGTAKCFDAKTGDYLQTFNGHFHWVFSAVFSVDNNKILTASGDGTAKCFDVKTGDCLQTFNGHFHWVFSAVFSVDNNKILTASADSTAKCFDVKTGDCLRTFNGHSDWVNSAVFSSDNNKILTASADNTAKCFDAKTGECLQTFNGHSRSVNSAVFSSDNNKILTASGDNTAKCFDAKTGDCLQTFNGHSSTVNSAVFSSDNNKILTASGDNTAKCFDAKTGDCLQTFNGHSDSVKTAVFSKDETKNLTASDDGTVRIWSLTSGEVLWILQVFKDATAVIDTEGRVIRHEGDIWRYVYGLLNGEVVCPVL